MKQSKAWFDLYNPDRPKMRYDQERHLYVITFSDGKVEEYEKLSDAMWAFEHPGEKRPSLWDVIGDIAEGRKLAANNTNGAEWNHRSPITGHFTGGDRGAQ